MTNEEFASSDAGPAATKAAGPTDLMRTTYEAWAAFDIDTIRSSWADDVVFHVSGQHPLSGDRSGPDDVLGYLAAVAGIGGGKGGFEVLALAASGELGTALVEGTAYCGDRRFTRTIVHVFRVVDGRLVEFWDKPLDGDEEDAFWTAAAGVPRSATIDNADHVATEA